MYSEVGNRKIQKGCMNKFRLPVWKEKKVILISNFCCVLNVVYFLLGNSPVSELIQD